MATDAVLRPAWDAPANVRALVTTRVLPGASVAPYDAFNLGDHVGDDPAAVAANRTMLEREFALPAAPRWLAQVHGTVVLEPGAATARAEADGAIARAPGEVCVVLTADCLPILLARTDGTAVAAVHAGWRGLARGIVERAVARLGRDLVAWIGPAICARCYEVDAPVRESFYGDDHEHFAATRPGHWQFDLTATAAARLARAGVASVVASGICTACDARFYSHRRDGRTGRFATLAWIAP
ncbi:MAG TPA: peptidoglycan editing factor PgeF [Xanthomonadales bacterium]|nr:peptidoglycan editing factor PgeF [Xanthomonadales bacterium]